MGARGRGKVISEKWKACPEHLGKLDTGKRWARRRVKGEKWLVELDSRDGLEWIARQIYADADGPDPGDD
jgi:hypothetical protein